MGTRSKGPHRTDAVTISYTYSPPMRAGSKLARRGMRLKRGGYARRLAEEFAVHRKPSRRARGKRKKAYSLNVAGERWLLDLSGMGD